MATPSAPPISLNQIAAELAGPANLAYYRGRTYYRNGSPVVLPAGVIGLYDFFNLTQNPAPSALAITGFTPTSPHQVFRPTPGVLSSSQSVLTTGGVAPLSYNWSIVSNTAGGGISSGQGTPTCGFNTAAQVGGFVGTTVLRCTVTDANSVQVAADFTINWEVLV
jgi:hypothetical protein